jgi:hypothetical protein
MEDRGFMGNLLARVAIEYLCIGWAVETVALYLRS